MAAASPDLVLRRRATDRGPRRRPPSPHRGRARRRVRPRDGRARPQRRAARPPPAVLDDVAAAIRADTGVETPSSRSISWTGRCDDDHRRRNRRPRHRHGHVLRGGRPELRAVPRQPGRRRAGDGPAQLRRADADVPPLRRADGGRGPGGIVLVSSGAGLVGAPNMVAYGATKAFDMVMAEALWAELHDQGVDVLGLVLGVTDTPALRAACSPNAA